MASPSETTDSCRRPAEDAKPTPDTGTVSKDADMAALAAANSGDSGGKDAETAEVGSKKKRRWWQK